LRRFDAASTWLFGGLALATALAALARLGWPFELFSHFRLQYAAFALLLAAVLAARRRALALAALALAAWHLLPSLRVAAASPPNPDCEGPAFTVITANLQYSNRDQQSFLDWLSGRSADLLVVQEVTPAWARALEALPDYPDRHVLARDDPYGMAVLSRRPFLRVDSADLTGDGLPSVDGAVPVGGAPVRFLALHTHWPIVPALARARDAALGAAATRTAGAAEPVVLLGDLNLTADSPAYRRLLRDGGLRDVQGATFWRPTWMAGLWPLALRIDHILVSPQWCVEHVEVGPAIGSDHRPVLARLRLATPPSPAGAARESASLGR
jgi:endonuclease/exonuclease/phosphatase (EEP) superfamily protein YafD